MPAIDEVRGFSSTSVHLHLSQAGICNRFVERRTNNESLDR